MTDDDLEILRLVKAYREACDRMPALWAALVASYPDSAIRAIAVRAHTDGRIACRATRHDLMRQILGARMEVQ